MDEKREEAAVVIHSFAALHGVVALLLANTLVGDTAILTALTYSMIHILADTYDITNVSPVKIAGRIFGLVAGTYMSFRQACVN